MSPRRSRREVGRLLRAQDQTPLADPTFTRELASVAAQASTNAAAPRRWRLAVVAVVAPLGLAGASFGVAYGAGVVDVPWHRDAPAPEVPPASVPATPKDTTDPSPSPSDGGGASSPAAPSGSSSPDLTRAPTVSPGGTASGAPTGAATTPAPISSGAPTSPTGTASATPTAATAAPTTPAAATTPTRTPSAVPTRAPSPPVTPTTSKTQTTQTPAG